MAIIKPKSNKFKYIKETKKVFLIRGALYLSCDLIHANGVKEKKLEVIEGYIIKYHANGNTIWSKGKMVNDQPEGYWEWFRPDDTIKRSGYSARK